MSVARLQCSATLFKQRPFFIDPDNTRMSHQPSVSSAALHRLADRLGVLRHYVSAAGEDCSVSDSSLRLLCTAAGLDARSDEAVAASLAAAGTDLPLDPVLVATEGQLLVTAWRTRSGEQDVPWQIEFEHGGGVGGVTAPEGTGVQASLRIALDGVPTGYHRLTVGVDGERVQSKLIVAPPRCWTPPHWQQAAPRDWSITTQLYALRSARNWGIGDFSDLAELAHHAAAQGASSVGLNPLHALFPANPLHLSPYSPSSRMFLNPVYIDVEMVPGYAECAAARGLVDSPGFQARLQAARASQFVDYQNVWQLKLEVLRALFDELAVHTHRQTAGEQDLDFTAFKQLGGTDLQHFALFEALQAHRLAAGDGLSWRDWPAAFRDITSPEVAAFAAAHADAIEFSKFLQWEADRQLGAAAALMRRLGMSTGIYRDVAVGVDPGGAEAWADQSLLVAGASVGAPPDTYNPKGQDWGLAPFNPVALRQRGYAPFIAAVRANMRHAGAVRIDHVIGLKRLYWVPSGAGPAAGGYVAYPFDDLMAIVALESQRQQCLVVGEDLGTVPEGFRADAESRALLSYRVLMFEREHGDGAFLPPSHYPAMAAAAVSTHDLPTLAGLWTGRDLAWRSELDLYADAHGAQRDIEFRQSTREALIAALVADGDLAPAAAAHLADPNAGDPATAAAIARLVEAAHVYLGKTASRLMLVQIEDLGAEAEQMNLPGTVDQHPNWRRKLQRSIGELFADPDVVRITQAINQSRSIAAAG